MKTTNTKLSAATIIEEYNRMEDRLFAERFALPRLDGTCRTAPSTAERYAMSAKAAETLLRHGLYRQGLRSRSDFRARSANRADIVLTINGKRARADVKTGGTVCADAREDWNEDDIMRGIAYVIFPVIDTIVTEEDLFDNTAIIDRDTFLTLCAESSRKGLRGTFHITGGCSRSAVIAFQPHPLNVLRRRIEHGIALGEFLTARQYAQDNGIEID